MHASFSLPVTTRLKVKCIAIHPRCMMLFAHSSHLYVQQKNLNQNALSNQEPKAKYVVWVQYPLSIADLCTAEAWTTTVF